MSAWIQKMPETLISCVFDLLMDPLGMPFGHRFLATALAAAEGKAMPANKLEEIDQIADSILPVDEKTAKTLNKHLLGFVFRRCFLANGPSSSRR